MAANEITVLNEEITELHKEREAIDQRDPKYHDKYNSLSEKIDERVNRLRELAVNLEMKYSQQQGS